MQLHGGNGYTEEHGLKTLHRDAHGDLRPPRASS
jgi:alkylation response protein AidB-like acyl-CoA dehydrogenase